MLFLFLGVADNAKETKNLYSQPSGKNVKSKSEEKSLKNKSSKKKMKTKVKKSENETDTKTDAKLISNKNKLDVHIMIILFIVLKIF